MISAPSRIARCTLSLMVRAANRDTAAPRGDFDAAAHQRAKSKQPDTEPVFAAVAVLLEHAFRDQRHRQPVRGALRDAEPLRQRADADVDFGLGERRAAASRW